MPLHEFRCPQGHITERLFATYEKADKVDYIVCPLCPADKPYAAEKITSAGAFILGGSPGGWEKPSPTAKRTVNPDSISFTGDSDYFK